MVNFKGFFASFFQGFLRNIVARVMDLKELGKKTFDFDITMTLGDLVELSFQVGHFINELVYAALTIFLLLFLLHIGWSIPLPLQHKNLFLL